MGVGCALSSCGNLTSQGLQSIPSLLSLRALRERSPLVPPCKAPAVYRETGDWEWIQDKQVTMCNIYMGIKKI